MRSIVSSYDAPDGDSAAAGGSGVRFGVSRGVACAGVSGRPVDEKERFPRPAASCAASARRGVECVRDKLRYAPRGPLTAAGTLGVRRTLWGVRRIGTGSEVPSADAVRRTGATRVCGVDTGLGRSSLIVAVGASGAGPRGIQARHFQQLLYTGGYLAHARIDTSGTAPHDDMAYESGDDNEPFLRLFAYLLTLPDAELPRVLSLSYADPEATVPEAYARRVCTYAALLGLRGVTLVVGSGDEGVGPAKASHCPTGGDDTTQFVPWFPSTCPYLTSVGGTATPPYETVADRTNAGFSTGSGFSNYFAQPAWQQGVVGRYVNESVAPAFQTHFWAGGRAYPDVAAVAAGLATWTRNAYAQTSGTSASAPIFAATVALLNDVRLAANASRLGFLNPLLYTQLGAVPKAFNDVQQGSNPGCGTAGFNATPGWDAASGFGTPNFDVLRRAVLAGCAARAAP